MIDAVLLNNGMKLSPRKRVAILLVGIAIPAFVVFKVMSKPRVLAVNEVPIAYWAWRTNAPDPIDLEKAFAITNAKILFLRAGQFDSTDEGIKRIRPLVGTMPAWVELHLVYNTTPDLLKKLDTVDTKSLAATIVQTYKEDMTRSRNENAQVFGMQLDFDYPNRLLPKYAELLREIRVLLPKDTKLSITGLPAWMATADLPSVLEQTDFWIPQCYGATIPTKLTQRIPISSAAEVARTVTNARRLGKPFYAGLAVYSYAILYGKDGKLVELRGNIDPAEAEGAKELELIESRPFDSGGASEIRYEYRAKDDVVLDGLTVRTGQTLVFDVPTATALRESAKAVRETAGELLKGICLFRLPTATDESLLSIGEVSSALSDAETKVSTDVSALTLDDGRLYVEVNNSGTASAMLGDDAFVVDIDFPAGSLPVLTSSRGFHAYHTLCRTGDGPPQPCSSERANVIRLEARSWRTDDGGLSTIEVRGPMPSQLTIHTTFHVDDGRTQTDAYEIPINKDESN